MTEKEEQKHLEEITLVFYQREWERLYHENPSFADTLYTGIYAGLSVDKVYRTLLAQCDYRDRSGFLTTVKNSAKWLEHERSVGA